MNSTSLYVTTNQIILKSNPSNPATWQDLYRLVPYLRNSLCCVVCGNLLVDPLTPTIGRCQHHLCRCCTGGRKKIKPACAWCKETNDYSDNKHLRILLQCYKNMCVSLVRSEIYKGLTEQAEAGVERGAANLIALITEGAAFLDDYESKGGLPRSTYSILPCVYTNSSTQTLQLNNPSCNNSVNNSAKQVINNSNVNSQNRTCLYSVMFAGSGNKITIKRKPKDVTTASTTITTTPTIAMPTASPTVLSTMNADTRPKTVSIKRELTEKSVFKKPPAKCITKPKRGCRCGNATLTPGKLTCCGQRCPCYVDNKACLECKCRGCRNPHRPDGNKVLNVRPVLPQLEGQQFQIKQKTAIEPQIGLEINYDDQYVGNHQYTNFQDEDEEDDDDHDDHDDDDDDDDNDDDDDGFSNEDSDIIVDV